MASLSHSHHELVLPRALRTLCQLAEGPLFIFGHGSLLHPGSVAKTLHHRAWDWSQLVPVRLHGYRRAFSALALNTERLADADGRVPPFFAWLNLERDITHAALGVIFETSTEEVDLLDRRENSYDRVDVTESMEALASDWWFPPGARVMTYLQPVPDPALWRSKCGYRGDYAALIARAAEHWGPAFQAEHTRLMADTPLPELLTPSMAERYRV